MNLWTNECIHSPFFLFQKLVYSQNVIVRNRLGLEQLLCFTLLEISEYPHRDCSYWGKGDIDQTRGMAWFTGQMQRRTLLFLMEEKHLGWTIFFVTYRTMDQGLEVVEERFHRQFCTRTVYPVRQPGTSFSCLKLDLHQYYNYRIKKVPNCLTGFTKNPFLQGIF